MLILFLAAYVLAHVSPHVAAAVSVMAWCSAHKLVTFLVILFLA